MIERLYSGVASGIRKYMGADAATTFTHHLERCPTCRQAFEALAQTFAEHPRHPKVTP